MSGERTEQRTLLLIGSPHADGASASLGRYPLSLLAEAGRRTDEVRLYPALAGDERRRELVERLLGAELVLLSAPLYCDGLPAAVVEALELWSRARREANPPPGQALAAVVNSGFPEPEQSRFALTCARLFCEQSGVRWLGGLACGAGAQISGKDPAVQGPPPWREALRLTAEALAAGRPVPHHAVELAARVRPPGAVYYLFSNPAWYALALKNRALRRFKAQPHLR